MHTVETDQCPDHSDGRHRYGPFGECMGTTCKAQSILHPCRSPYCECEPGKCTHPGFRDARHETAEITDEESRLRAIFEATAKDSFNFRRSRRGTYVNPAIARDWKWFYLGATKGNALTQRPAAQTEREADGLPLIVAGAIFDFAGFMTTRSEVIEVGSTAEAGPVADLVKEWAELRGLNLADAAVLSWQLHINRASLPAPQQATPERHLTVTTNQQGEAVMVSWQDDEHRILDVVWERKQATPEPVGEPVGTVVHTKLNG